MERVLKNSAAALIDRRDLDAGQMLCAAGDGHGMAAQNLDPGSTNRFHQLAAKVTTQIDDQHMRAGRMERQRRAIGIIIVGEDDGAVARYDTIAVDVGPHRAGQHHPGKIIAGKDQGTFMRALRQHGLRGPHLPQTLARQMRWWAGHMVGDGFCQRQEIMVHITKHGGPRQQRDIIHRRQLGNHPGDPACRCLAIDRHVSLAKKPATKFILLVGQDHAGTASRGL